MNSDSNSNTLEEEARILIEKQEEFKAKILAERSMHLSKVAELDELLAKLGGVKRSKPRQKADEGENGGEASVPLDDEEEAVLALKISDGPTAIALENWRPDPTLDKKSQILEIVRMKGPQLRGEIIKDVSSRKQRGKGPDVDSYIRADSFREAGREQARTANDSEPIETSTHSAICKEEGVWEVTDKATRITYRTFGGRSQVEERLEHQESMKRLPKRPNLGAGRYGSNGKGSST